MINQNSLMYQYVQYLASVNDELMEKDITMERLAREELTEQQRSIARNIIKRTH